MKGARNQSHFAELRGSHRQVEPDREPAAVEPAFAAEAGVALAPDFGADLRAVRTEALIGVSMYYCHDV